MLPEITEAIEKFEETVRYHAWRGGGRPADIPVIEEEYKQAKSNLLFLIRKALKWGDKRR